MQVPLWSSGYNLLQGYSLSLIYIRLRRHPCIDRSIHACLSITCCNCAESFGHTLASPTKLTPTLHAQAETCGI